MNRKLLILTVCILTGWSVYGQKFVRISKSNAPQTVQLQANEALELNLPANPSTGYGWYLKDKKSGLLKLAPAGDFIPDNKNNSVGGSGNQVVHLIAESRGTTNLEMVYMRPWLGQQSAIDSYKLTVITAGKYNGVSVQPIPTPAVAKYRSTNSTLPASFSWLSQGIMTVVKDQGQCGSCWSFAACGSFESVINYWDKVKRDFAEQWLVNCDKACNGCSGGWCPDDMFKTYGGVYEADAPYGAQDGTCASSYTYHEKATGYTEVGANPTIDQIKQAIYDHGPVWATVDAGTNFQNYSSGILKSSDGTTPDHAIVLLGWSDTDQAWILRNSWGTSWGENNGYMRIGYNVSVVGGTATWIDYKGQIPHSIPPAVAFATVNTACTPTVQFKDNTSNNPTSWLWKFGDGTTSTQQNPSHTYANNGTYSVSLLATNAYGKDSVSRPNSVTISMMTAPTTTNDTRTGSGVVNLSASASGGGTIDWYDAASAGNLVSTGPTYSPNLTTTTTFYVANEMLSASQHTGLTDNTAGGSYYTANTDRRLYFNALSDMTLKSVTIYANTAGSRSIDVLDSLGNIVATSPSFNAVVGKNVVPLNFNIPKGTGYAIKLATSSASDLFRNNTGVTYPYSVSGLVSITNSDAATTPGSYYYYFYDWIVSGQSCSSSRTPVVGTVNGITGITSPGAATAFKVYPNPSNGIFSVEGLENENTIQVFDVIGKLIYQTRVNSSSCTIDLGNQGKGIYFYRIQNLSSKSLREGKVMVY
jgi:PKD repeat protein/predicted secreted protein